MTDLLKILVDTGDSSRQVDRLTQSYERLDNATASFAAKAPSALKQVQEAMKRTGESDQFSASLDNALTSLSNGTAKAVKLVKDQNAALQGLYEARLATAGRLSNAELNLWKNHGANLGKLQSAQLKGFEVGLLLDKVSALSRVEVGVYSSAEKLKKAVSAYDAAYAGLYSGSAKESPLRSIRVATAEDAAVIAAEMRKFYTQMSANADVMSRLGVLAKDKSPLRSIRVATAEDAAVIAAEMRKFYTQMQSSAEVWAKSGMLAKDNSPLRSIRVATEADSAAILQTMQKFYADQQRILNNIAITKATTSPLASIRKPTESDSKDVLAGMREYYLGQGAKSKYGQTSFDATEKETTKLTTANKALSGSFKQLAVDGNDVHSMARGLASSFGLLWLTWGNLIPLFAGAAISASVKNVVTLGAEVQHTMETVRVLSQESTTAIAGLNEQLLVMARSGPFGPQEVANAMKTLSLAGLSAGEVSASVQDVLNFAVAGTTDLKTAADVMTTVATAFNITAHGYNYVGDIIAKTAAVSKSSVESIGEAFKTSSVLFKQYGASLEDVGVGLAALSNLGIQGSAAGTALRNMYVDLSGRTPKVTKAMKELGLELKDQNGRFVDLITMTERVAKAMSDLEGKGRAKALATILSERGGKPVIELLDLAEKRAKSFSTTVATELERMRNDIGNSAGFMAQAAIQLAMTPQSQLKSIGATLQATLVETFAGMEPEILAFSRDLKNIFNSPEFKDGLKTLATSALDFGRALATVTSTIVQHTQTVLTVIAAYYAARTGIVAYTAMTAASTAATIADTAATRANAAAKAGALAGVARFLPGVGTAVTIAGLAWAAYETFVNSAKRAEQGYVDSGYGSSIVQRLQEETKRIKELNDAKALGISLDELRARKAVSNSALESSAARADAEAKLQRASDILERAKAEGLKGVIKDKTRDFNEAKEKLEAAKEVERLQKGEVERNIVLRKQEAKREAELNKPTRPDITGTKGFDMPETQGSRTGARATLDSILKREQEQEAALGATGIATTEFDKINVELVKNLKGLDAEYKSILKNYPELESGKKEQLEKQKEEIKNLIEKNSKTQIEQALAKQEYEYTIKRIEASYAEIQATDELANARFKAAKESERQIGLADRRFEFEQSIKYELPMVQAAEKAKYDVRASYAEKLRQLEQESNKRLGEMLEANPNANIQPELDSFNRAKEAMNQEAIAQVAKASANTYKTEWDKVTGTIASNFASKLMSGTLDLKEFMLETFANMVLQPQIAMAAQQGMDWLIKAGISAMTGMPSFEGGGSTGTGPRSGGLDGKGGYMAMVHPNETVIDHTKGGGSQGSSAPVYITINNTVGDVATKSMLDQANAATVKQIQAGMARSARYNGAMAR